MNLLYKILFILTFISCDSSLEISPIFYEVSSEKGKIYILGSVHSSDGSIFPLPDYIMDGFNESKEFIMELKPFEKDTLFKSENINEEIYYIKDHVSEETYQLIIEISKSLSIPQNILTSLAPQEIINLVEGYELQKVGVFKDKGVESYFYYLAKEKNIKIDGFESYSEILKNIKTIDSVENEKRLVDYLNNRKEIAEETKQLLDFWKYGNEEKLLEKVKWFSSKYPTFTDKLLLERNHKISHKVINLLGDEDTVFVTIGLGHLIGEGNIIEILRRKGYHINKIKKAK